MNDRELLEAAAKAAGIEYVDLYQEWPWFRTASGLIWNPLADDADALRLAVKLGLELLTNAHGKAWVVRNNGDIDSISEPHGSDMYAATRRAVVRAAAAIGAQSS